MDRFSKKKSTQRAAALEKRAQIVPDLGEGLDNSNYKGKNEGSLIKLDISNPFQLAIPASVR